MKKLIQILVLGMFIAGCAGLPNINLPQFVATPTSPPPAATLTPFPTKTPTPTPNLFATSTSTPLTFTPTVTSIGAELFTPTGTETEIPTDTPITLPTTELPPLPGSEGYFTPPSRGFLSVLLSNSIMYWNAGPCEPREIKFSAFVEDPINTHRVFLFTRLREKKNTLNVTRWNAGALMVKADNGSFNYTIHTWNLRRYYYFREAWLEYQLVALTEDQEEVGRTPIYNKNITLAMCRPVS
jgi:hypothetical protein